MSASAAGRAGVGRDPDARHPGAGRGGFVNFGFAEGGFALLMGNRPIVRLVALKGQKLWVPEGDTVTSAVMEELGLSLISLPISDVLTGLQTGLVHIIGVSPIGVQGAFSPELYGRIVALLKERRSGSQR